MTGRVARRWSPRTWTLQVRLLVTLVALLAVVCAVIGVATELALHRFLMQQLDVQVVDAGRRSVAISDMPPPPSDRDMRMGQPRPPGPGPRERFDPEEGPGPGFLNVPGQATLTVGAAVSADGVDAAVINADGGRSTLTPTAEAQLAAVPLDHRPRTIDLDGLGAYRVIAVHQRHGGQTIVTGLPIADVQRTLLWVLGMFCVVSFVALLAATSAGIVLIRRQLAPLARVSATAREVADLELDRGEVRLPTPIVRVDPDAEHTEVGQLGLSLNRMLDRIAGALSARQASETRVRRFVSDASHELRTPLAAIRGYTELVQRKRDVLPDDVAHAMSRVESETERMTQLVEDMLLLARLDEGRPLARETVDLSQLTIDAVSDAHVASPDHEWRVEVPDEPVVVTGDGARLHQVLANLLTNAHIHTPAGTTVTTSLTTGGDDVVLTIADDGPGIPATLQPEVFERFARGDSSRSRRGGSTGLGLAIVAAVVRAHRGTIDVRSAPGSTEFVVTLPTGSQVTHSAGSTGT